LLRDWLRQNNVAVSQTKSLISEMNDISVVGELPHRILHYMGISRQVCVRDERSAEEKKAYDQRVGLRASSVGPWDRAARNVDLVRRRGG
jgi:hypothetical protein